MTSHLEVHRFFLVCDMQHQITQHLMASELIHDLHRTGSVGLDGVVKVTRPTHRGNHDRREIGTPSGTLLPDGAVHLR